MLDAGAAFVVVTEKPSAMLNAAIASSWRVMMLFLHLGFRAPPHATLPSAILGGSGSGRCSGSVPVAPKNAFAHGSPAACRPIWTKRKGLNFCHPCLNASLIGALGSKSVPRRPMPSPSAGASFSRITAMPVLGGLHHVYQRAAWTAASNFLRLTGGGRAFKSAHSNMIVAT
jgi:hypothetical protein